MRETRDNMKKEYTGPRLTVVSLPHEGSLLTASQVLVGGEVGAPALPPVDPLELPGIPAEP